MYASNVNTAFRQQLQLALASETSLRGPAQASLSAASSSKGAKPVGLAGLLKTFRTLLASSCKRGTQSGCNGIALQALPAAWQAGHMHYLVSGAVEPCRSPAPTCCCPQWSLAGRGNNCTYRGNNRTYACKHSQNEPSSGLCLDSKLSLLCLVGLNMGPHAA